MRERGKMRLKTFIRLHDEEVQLPWQTLYSSAYRYLDTGTWNFFKKQRKYLLTLLVQVDEPMANNLYKRIES